MTKHFATIEIETHSFQGDLDGECEFKICSTTCGFKEHNIIHGYKSLPADWHEDSSLETQPMKRHTQPHDRYQITDSCCGLVATRTSLAKASEAAKIHAERHGSEGDNTVTVVEVFDTMARRDCMDTWKFPVSNAQSAT